MTKIVFLCFWYCAIYPGAFFITAFIMLVNYFMDRFSLMRSWKRAPQLGTRISQFSRRYFFSTAVVAMVVMSSYYWSGFPYDNLCEDNINIVLNPSYIGVYNFDTPAGDITFTIDESYDRGVYRYCKQDLIRTKGHTFPFIPSRQREGNEWMTPEQEDITTLFGWTAVVISGLVILKFLYGWIEMVQNFFKSGYKVSRWLEPC